MNEPLLERIQDLERAVQRWKLITLAFLFLLISATAIGGTFGVILTLGQNGLRDARLMEAEMMAREQADRARQAEMAARKQAEQALQEAERARQQAQQLEKKAAEQQPPAPIDP
jgi:hypothetical protein